MRSHRLPRNDDGVSLVIALLFIVVVGLFATAALSKSQSTTASGTALRDRSQLQYSLDAGVERALEVLQADIASGTPTQCLEAPEPETDLTPYRDSGGLSVNGQTITYSCQTLAGKAAKATDQYETNFAVITTKATSGGLVTTGGGGPFVINGSVYLANKTTAALLDKPIEVAGNGDIVADGSVAGCAADLAAATPLTIQAGSAGLKACTEQTLAQALPPVTLPAAPSNVMTDPPLSLVNGLPFAPAPGLSCTIYFPGTYRTAPSLSGQDSYFVSGLYYFEGNFQVDIANTAHVIAGAKVTPTDVDAATPSDCDSVTDTQALSVVVDPTIRAALASTAWAQGAEFVFGKQARLSVTGALVMRSPVDSPTNVAVNLFSARAADSPQGYSRATFATLLETPNANPDLTLNAKIFSPESDIKFFATLPTVTFARNGLVAETLTLKGSNQSGTLAVHAPSGKPKPNPPFRTVRVKARDATGSSSALTTAVATISNFPPYTTTVLSWRTD